MSTRAEREAAKIAMMGGPGPRRESPRNKRRFLQRLRGCEGHPPTDATESSESSDYQLSVSHHKPNDQNQLRNHHVSSQGRNQQPVRGGPSPRSSPTGAMYKTRDSVIEPMAPPSPRRVMPVPPAPEPKRTIPCDPATLVDVGGGVRLPLRGAEETRKAIKRDFFTPLVCISCSEEIFCIQNAKCCICPSCRDVTPLDTGAGSHGVGLGFTLETLALMQWECINDDDQQDDSTTQGELPTW